MHSYGNKVIGMDTTFVKSLHDKTEKYKVVDGYT